MSRGENEKQSPIKTAACIPLHNDAISNFSLKNLNLIDIELLARIVIYSMTCKTRCEICLFECEICLFQKLELEFGPKYYYIHNGHQRRI